MSDSEHTKKPNNGADRRDVSQFFDNMHGQTVIYQYLCPKCHHISEERFLFGCPDHTIPCQTPDCGGTAMKIISTPGILTGIPTHQARKGRGKGK